MEYVIPALEGFEEAWEKYNADRPYTDWGSDRAIQFARVAVEEFEFGTAIGIVVRESARAHGEYKEKHEKAEAAGKNPLRNKVCEIAEAGDFEAKWILRLLIRDLLPKKLEPFSLHLANALIRKHRIANGDSTEV